MQTGKKNGEAADNVTAFTFNQRVLDRSLVKGYFLNRTSTSLTAAEKAAAPLEKRGTNEGIELLYSDKSGAWQAWYGHHLSHKAGIKNKNQYINAGGGYFGTKLSTFITTDLVGQNYYTDLGFVQRIENYDAALDTNFRRGYHSLYNENEYSFFFPKHKSINRFRINHSQLLIQSRVPTQFNYHSNEVELQLDNKNTSSFSINYGHYYEKLLYPSKFVDDDLALPLPVGNYYYQQIGAAYNSDNRKNFSYGVSGTIGKFYNAKYTQLTASIFLRKQPKLNIGIEAEYNNLVFPNIYGSEQFLLLSPNVEYNFSTKLFWTTFLQFNTQNNNFNINSRLQYRFKPQSDLFIVYTDNYFTDPLLKNKNRALVVKLNYWFNL
jgi:hypothetical protein